jgi:hypothetical protein
VTFPRRRFLIPLALALFTAMAAEMANANGNSNSGATHHNGGNSTSTSRADADATAVAAAASNSQSGSASAAEVGDVNTVALSMALSGCQQGAGAAAAGFGATFGAESRTCQLLRAAVAHAALGQPYEAMRLVRQATAEINGGGYTPGEAPVLARFFRAVRREVVAPLFGWLPFIGHAV